MTKPIASIKRVNELLIQHGLHAKKHYGQNFIIDRNIIDKIVAVANISKENDVLEIGPGIGSLSEAVGEKANFVTAVEIDPKMVEILEETLNRFDNVEVIQDDFLKFDTANFKKDNLIVCANLPYYVTTPILFKLFDSEIVFKKIVVMVQKEVAMRFKASKDTKQYNALSIFAQTCFDVSLAFDVSKHVFFPKPDVDSSILVFVPKPERNCAELKPIFEFIKKCFAQRRKTLANNLKEIISNPNDAISYLEKANLDTNIRAQSLEFEDFKRLYECIYP
jgi:16S rRNA (adenine1518-N6/adenine1519-N6)-dimethyltransferase